MSVFSISLSGMQAAQAAMNVSAGNIANTETPGYRRQTVVDRARADGGVDVSLSTAGPPGSDAIADTVDLMAAKDDFIANVSVFKAQDQASGSLLDMSA